MLKGQCGVFLNICRLLPITELGADKMTDEGKTKAQLLGEVVALRQQVADLQAAIAAHAQTEEALRERAEQFQNFFEHANDVNMALTLGGIFTAVNRGTEVLLGWSREEQIGRHYCEFLTPTSLTLVEERARRIAAGEKVSSIYEVELLRKDGRVVPVEARARFIRNREGQPIGILAIHRDISARKEAEETLRHSEQELADFFEHAPMGLHWVGPDGTILRVNQAELDLLGYTREEYVGHHIAEFHADPPVIADILQRLTRGQTLNDYEARLRCKDGSLKTVLLSSNVRWEGERFLHTRCFTRDITARKRAEEGLRIYGEIVRHMQIGLYVYHLEDLTDDRTLRLVATNPAATQFTGVAMDRVVGKILDENFPGLRANGIPQLYAAVVRSGQAVELEEVSYGDDRVLHGAFSVKAFPLPNQCMGVVFENITARKQAEEALRRSERFNASLIAQSPLGIVTYTPDGNITSVNQAWEHMWGVSWAQVQGYNVWTDPQLVGTPLREALERLVQQGGATPSFELDYNIGTTLPGGNRRWTSCRFYTVQGEDGEVTQLICLNEDIAKRKQMEEQLRESEERYRSLFEHASDGIACLTADGIITSVNRGVEAMLGWSREEMVGQSYQQFHTPSSLLAEEARLRRIRAREKVSSIAEIELVHKEGSVVPVEARTRFIRTQDGQPIGVLAILRDVTERRMAEEALRQAEKRYRSIFENAIEGIFQSTPSGAILAANPALAHMLGYESPEELKAQVTNVGTQLYADPHRRAEVLEPLREQDTVHGVECQLSRKDGSTLWGSVSIRAVRDATGALLYYEGSLEDISQRRAAEQMKDEFVSVVSHELRTPLTSIRGSLGLLASGMLGPLPEKGQRMLDIAVRNTDRLVRLINDILDVERIQSGKASMVKTNCPVADLMTHTVEEMRGMAEKAEVTLVVQPVQAELWVDPDRIIQTLTNLLSNAIKFSPAGATVWLTADWWGEQLLVQVKDQGRGIPAEKLESIFERFQQVDVSDSRDKGGTGLGLAICRSIVHQHGGRIWAESTLGKGSTFFFTLPLVKEERPAAPVSSVGSVVSPGNETRAGSGASNGQVRRLQVLVAEDDRDLARVLIAMFERHGAVVYYAQTGAEAIQCCNLVVPDLLVLDPIMPEQDGFAVVDWLRQREPPCQVPVVVYGAGELTATEQQRLTLGPTLFFTKSRISPEHFEQHVLQWLDQIMPADEKCYS